MARVRASIGIVLVVWFVTALQPAAWAGGATPIERALAAVDLTVDQLHFDRLDMGLYGGDEGRLHVFDAWIDRPLRIPGDVEVEQRRLLGSAGSPSRLFMTATSKLGTSVRRGLITDPVTELRESMSEGDPLASALRSIWKRSDRTLLHEEGTALDAAAARLPDSLAMTVALLLQASVGAIDSRAEALSPLDVAPGRRGRGLGRDRFDPVDLERNAIEYVVNSDAGNFTAAFARSVEEPAQSIDYRLWNLGTTDLLLVVEKVLPSLRRQLLPFGAQEWRVETPLGSVVIAGNQSNRHTGESPLLLIDSGGDDTYDSGAGGSWDRPVSILIDLGGNDRYVTADTLSPCFGAGILGVGILIDEDGNDLYRGGHVSLGAGLYGVGILIDKAGKDRYDAITASQGAGLFGVGILADLEGDDSYHAFQQIQGYGYVRGVGFLIDARGDDVYIADDEQIRFPSSQSKEDNTSLAQGFGFGKRSDFVDGHSLAGGVGYLIDGEGDDEYRCGVFGQGCAYWYGVGLLADSQGNDLYDGIWYVQGSGAHFALGILWEGGGDDSYHATKNMAIGAGHDFSLGFLYDRAGNDRYRAPNLSLGGGNANGIGIFWDVEGEDQYEVEAATTLGRANVASRGGMRDRIETLGLFIDTGGNDTYPASKTFAGNDRLWTQTGLNEERPLDTERGVGIDTTWTPGADPGWRMRRNDR